MDQANKMKLTKYGFHFNLLKFSYILSILGIFVSIIGIFGSIAAIVWFWSAFWGVLVAFIIPYLVMWTSLRIKTNKKDIPGIEKIGKYYGYVSGSLETIHQIYLIIIIIHSIESINKSTNIVSGDHDGKTF